MTNRKINLYFHTGSSNHGCEAIVRGTNEILDKKLRLFSFNPEDEVKYNLNQIVEVFGDTITPIKKFSLKFFIAAIQSKFLNSTTLVTKFTKTNVFSKIDRGDICLSIGGDNYTYQGVWELENYNKILHRKGAKTVLWGCSIDSDIIPKIVKDLNNYDLIIARETLTFNALKKEGVTSEIRLCSDPAFQLKKNEVELPKNFSVNNTVGINLSPLILNYGNSALILENFANLIQYLISETDFQIALIPHVVSLGNDDRDILQPIYEKFRSTNRIVFLDDLCCSDLKGFISNCRFFMGARTHATIAAYSTEVPAIAIGYSMKAKGIAQDIFGTFENYVCPVQDFQSGNELINCFNWLVANEESIREHYRKVMPQYRESAKKASDFLNII